MFDDIVTGDMLNSSDIIAAMDELQDIIDDDEYSEDERGEAQDELIKFETFTQPFEGYSDWDHGETLIAEDYWVDYVEDMLKDTGYISDDLPDWIVIDWEATAENVAADYICDNGYYMRAT